MIPKRIKKEIERIVQGKITSIVPQHGGDINHSVKLIFGDKTELFLKWNTSAPAKMFEAEAKGLDLLRSGKTGLTIPNIIWVGNDFLLMDFVKEEPALQDSSFNFGRALANIHKSTSSQFGLDHHNYIGKLPQRNTKHNSWPEFFIAERIEPLLKLGIDSGKLNKKFSSNIDLLTKITENLFPIEPPSLIHGDLWSGNYMFTAKGKASIYDPAVYYGHREMDLAMTRLFGGFNLQFYKGYEAEYPLEDGFEERLSLCNLYPVLVHAVLFGGNYWQSASTTILKYIS